MYCESVARKFLFSINKVEKHGLPHSDQELAKNINSVPPLSHLVCNGLHEANSEDNHASL